MFVLSEFEEVIRIEPQRFNEEFYSTIQDHLNANLANKVVVNVGLCITLFDVLNVGDSHILPGDGAHFTKVRYRFIVFRPTIGEILSGKVKSCSVEGVCVSLGFFDDILVPASSLQHPSVFNSAEHNWIWTYENEDGSKHELYLDQGDEIKFRIMAEKFNELLPTGKVEDTKSETKVETPYVLIGSMNEPGLGVLSWWDGM